MPAREDDATPGGGRVSDAATRLAQDTRELARHEIRAMRGELMAGLRRFAASGTLAAGAGVCGILALWATHETVLRAVESVLPKTRAAAVLACVYASGAVALGLGARDRMRAAAEAAAEALEHEHERMPSAPAVAGQEPPES
jgi:hypothetical protein